MDKIIRSAIKEILNIPKETPDAMIYSPSCVRGLECFRAEWEAALQQLNIINRLEKSQVPIIQKVRKFDEEKRLCFNRLGIEQNIGAEMSTTKMRAMLREREVEKWSNLPFKGKGVKLFSQVTKVNKSLTIKGGLTTGEFTESIKMCSNSVSVRANPGRSREGIQCRRCVRTETDIIPETLPHVLGKCDFGQLLRNERHHNVRRTIANALREKGLVVHEEVPCIADSEETEGSVSRRIDIIAIDEEKETGIIVDPTVRFEVDENQPEDVNREKQEIYRPTIPFFKEKYKLKEINIIGLMIGARGTIPLFFKKFIEDYKLPEKIMSTIAQDTLRRSISILRNHLYAPNRIQLRAEN